MQDGTLRARGATLVFVVCLLGCLGFGCRNIYTEARDAYPADPGHRLDRRVAEAQKAEKRAMQAAVSLRQQMAQEPHTDQADLAIDRLERAAHDLQRCVVAVRDATSPESDLLPAERAEVDRLEAQAARLLAEVRQAEISREVPPERAPP